MGTWQDSLPHAWEHLMIVFFDVLVLDGEPILRHCLQDRRKVLRDLVKAIPGRSMRSEWTLLDFKTGDGIMDLKQCFARNVANRQEGLVLKPLHAPSDGAGALPGRILHKVEEGLSGRHGW
jgi:DNA ligase-4